jgi:VIT1/CCC1 family predicted Fe2+/Mn2+ transporter
VVVYLFSFYISVAREISFRRRFSEMALASLGVAALAFLIGYLARMFLHIHID